MLDSPRPPVVSSNWELINRWETELVSMSLVSVVMQESSENWSLMSMPRDRLLSVTTEPSVWRQAFSASTTLSICIIVKAIYIRTCKTWSGSEWFLSIKSKKRLAGKTQIEASQWGQSAYLQRCLSSISHGWHTFETFAQRLPVSIVCCSLFKTKSHKIVKTALINKNAYSYSTCISHNPRTGERCKGKYLGGKNVDIDSILLPSTMCSIFSLRNQESKCHQG